MADAALLLAMERNCHKVVLGLCVKYSLAGTQLDGMAWRVSDPNSLKRCVCRS
jgi:hypothetical protein